MKSVNLILILNVIINNSLFFNFQQIKAYSIDKRDDILKIYGISQNPDTKDYIMVLEHAEGGNFSNKDGWYWYANIHGLGDIIKGLRKIHEKGMVHRDFHIGNILLKSKGIVDPYISDMGLCGEVSNIDQTKVYGVMPYVAPEG